jgi:hypothetical protein
MVRIVVRNLGPGNRAKVLLHQRRGLGADRPVLSRWHGTGPTLRVADLPRRTGSVEPKHAGPLNHSRLQAEERGRVPGPLAHGLHTDSPGEHARSNRSTPDRSASAAWKLSVEFPVYVIVQLISSPMSPALAVLPLTLMLSFGAY